MSSSVSSSEPPRGASTAKRSIPDRPEEIRAADPGDMGGRIEGLAAQLRAAPELVADALTRIEPRRPPRIVLFGMGGSAIAGDLLRSLVDREGTAPFHVIRHYEPPCWVTSDDFLIFSSYSGRTEETLESFRATRVLQAPSCVLTTGGTLAEAAGREGIPVVTLPAGHPPRAALGYSFSALTLVAAHLKLLANGRNRLEAAARGVEQVTSACGRGVLQSRNPAKQLAIRLADRPQVILANERTLGPVALRWKGQLNENAKHLAWASPLPEMNHNEVDGFVEPPDWVGRLGAVMLRDPGDHPRVQARFRWLEGYLRDRGVETHVVDAEGDDSMTRLMTCAAFGDFVSYYLALVHGKDPSALPGVDSLKRALGG